MFIPLGQPLCKPAPFKPVKKLRIFCLNSAAMYTENPANFSSICDVLCLNTNLDWYNQSSKSFHTANHLYSLMNINDKKRHFNEQFPAKHNKSRIINNPYCVMRFLF